VWRLGWNVDHISRTEYLCPPTANRGSEDLVWPRLLATDHFSTDNQSSLAILHNKHICLNQVHFSLAVHLSMRENRGVIAEIRQLLGGSSL
jgi:hypothetical protein